MLLVFRYADLERTSCISGTTEHHCQTHCDTAENALLSYVRWIELTYLLNKKNSCKYYETDISKKKVNTSACVNVTSFHRLSPQGGAICV